MNRLRATSRSVVAHGGDALAITASAALFVWASSPAAAWLVDDAGNTYAYGINLGRYGQLAPNLEGMAVEGFSSPSTVLIVAILSALHCFHPLTTHRFLDVLVFGFIGLSAFRILRSTFPTSRWVAWPGLALFVGLEVCTPATMVWYGSGLENGQLTLAVLLLLWRLQVGLEKGFNPVVDGSILAGAATVRPEAPLFSLVWLAAAALLVLERKARDAGSSKGELRALIATAALTSSVLVGAEFLRYGLFASLAPNTFYAKVGKVNIAKNFDDYVRPSLGNYWYAFGLSASVVALFAAPKTSTLATALLLFSGAALALPLIAGGDWMGQHRFATAFLMLGHFSFAVACSAAWASTPPGPRLSRILRWIPMSAPAAAVLMLFAGGRKEYRSFLHGKYVGFALIADVEGFERVRLQRYLGLIYPVVALPDAGGSTVVGSLQLVDTAWLLDYHMARIRNDPGLVTQYQLTERRIDLAEYHGWSFDQGVVGTTFLAAAKSNAEEDYYGFWPAYAVRRDLVELRDPDAGSVRLGGDDDFDVYLSGRTVLVGAPRALLRVELLISPRRASWNAGCRLQLRLGAADDRRTVFTLSPLTETAIVPTTGLLYRHGFVVGLPSRSGDYSISVELCAGPGARTFGLPRPVLVRSPQDLSLVELRDRLGAPAGSDAELAHRIAQLREQLVTRLAPGERDRQSALFRASYRDGNRTSVDAYESLLTDSRPGFLAEMPASVKVLEGEVMRWAGETSSRLFADGARGIGARTLAIGRVVDDLRRLGYLGVVDTPPMGTVVGQILSAQPAAADTGDEYARALGLALLFPAKATYQRHLAEERSRRLALPAD